jgi:outer membrane protein
MKHSRRSRSGFAPLALLCAAVIGSWGSAAQAQSLLELYESARGYDAGYLSAKLQFEATLASAEQSKSGVRPSANLSAGVTYTDQNLGANSSATAAQVAALQASNRGFQTQSLSASASQPLYRPANRAAYDQAMQRVELAKAQLEVAEQELILRTSQAYFDVLAAQDNLTAVQAQRTAVSEQLAAAKRRFEVGTSTIVDTRQAQAAFDRIQAAQIQAENDLAVRRLALDQLVGRWCCRSSRATSTAGCRTPRTSTRACAAPKQASRSHGLKWCAPKPATSPPWMPRPAKALPRRPTAPPRAR